MRGKAVFYPMGWNDNGLHHAIGEHLAEDLNNEGVPRLILIPLMVILQQLDLHHE